MSYKLFTSESVCSGHPDKICDRISDSILDACYQVDQMSRVAVETLVTTNRIIIAGEITTKAKIDYDALARKVIKKLGYTDPIYNFDHKSVKIEVYIHEQSQDIAKGVLKLGAGDQGMMFGYATRETSELMPLPIALAHGLTKRMDFARESKKLPYLRPDGKSQVTIEYENSSEYRVKKVITAIPHDPKISKEKVSKDIYALVIRPVLKTYGYQVDFKDTICNGTGKWEIGGPDSDTGLTGRKIIVDTYGAQGRFGGGCFSGKDPTKVDRCGAYAARFIAKNIVAKKFADICEVQLAYVIGKRTPVAKSIETFGTERRPTKEIEKFAWSLLDLSVAGIIEGLDLRRPIYAKTSAYGHFGRAEFPWEKIKKSL